jgi:hypothetical protein
VSRAAAFRCRNPSHFFQFSILSTNQGGGAGMRFQLGGIEVLGRYGSGDHRSFAQVVKKKLAFVVMVPPRQVRGWGREGFSDGRYGKGAG